MIFRCPNCGFDCNVNRFPMRCCGVQHDIDSDAISEGELSRQKKRSHAAQYKGSDDSCVHRGKRIDRVWCSPCNNFKRVFECNVFGECTDTMKVGDMACCNDRGRRCPNYSSHLASVGITTAHRQQPTLTQSIESMIAAGWRDFRIFDDGDSSGLADSTVRRPASGAWSNWWLALSEMVLRQPHASYYLIVQDDSQFALGGRKYIESLPEIDTECVISLYCSARYNFDGLTAFTKGKDFTGAVALLITQPAAARLLSSGLGLSHRLKRDRGNDWIDGAIGEWCESNDVPLYVQAPGLVQHVGTTSTLGHTEKPSRNVVADVRDISTFRPTTNVNVGLIGWNTASGLGTLNRSIAKHIQVSSWLIPDHPDFNKLPDVPGVVSAHSSRPVPLNVYEDFIDGIDVLLFCEHPGVLGRTDVITLAKIKGVHVVCVPMIEWLDDAEQTGVGRWPDLVDLFLCPTRQCFDMMPTNLKNRSIYISWPIDTDETGYRQRTICSEFVFFHGTGGRNDRKGGLIVAEAARLAKEVPLVVYSQVADGIRSHSRSEYPVWPNHVEVIGQQSSQRNLYSRGDVCIQPSRMEGLGLQLLECQSAGIPLVTTDGPPMNEYEPLRTIKAVSCQDRVHRDIMRHDADPHDLAEIMREMIGTDVSVASDSARRFALSRSWSLKKHAILKAISGVCNESCK